MGTHYTSTQEEEESGRVGLEPDTEVDRTFHPLGTSFSLWLPVPMLPLCMCDPNCLFNYHTEKEKPQTGLRYSWFAASVLYPVCV